MLWASRLLSASAPYQPPLPAPPQMQGSKAPPSLHTCTPCTPPMHAQMASSFGVHVRGGEPSESVSGSTTKLQELTSAKATAHKVMRIVSAPTIVRQSLCNSRRRRERSRINLGTDRTFAIQMAETICFAFAIAICWKRVPMSGV